MGDQLITELGRGLTQVPDPEAAHRIAEALRFNWGVADDAKLNLAEIMRTIGAEMVLSDLGGAEGGPQGLLTPLPENAYRIEVDPSPSLDWPMATPALRDEVSRHRVRFVIAHELAHTLFYWRGGGTPERMVKDSKVQELFCDALASALLVPRTAAATAALRPESVVELHQRYDVSMEVAARALISAHSDGVGWLMVVPTEASEAWVQWGAERSREAIGPWRVLSKIIEKARQGAEGIAAGRLRWRSGKTTVARGLMLRERGQLVVTARAA